MGTNIKWYPINRKALPGVLIGMEQLPKSSSNVFDIVTKTDVAFGILAEYSQVSTDSPDKMIVVNEADAANLFSWLNTYTKESFPLSQFARVISYDDWSIVEHEKKDEHKITKSPWGCIVLGEMLGQSESNPDIGQLPLSRAMACFSFALAKTSLAYGSRSQAVAITSKRLRALEDDNRFLKRPIKVDELTKIWAFITALDTFDTTPIEAVEIISDVLNMQYPKDLLSDNYKPLDILFNMKDLLSDSAEIRVRAFDHLVDLTMNATNIKDSHIIPTIVAAGAFLVGRGTSHIGLLSSVSAKYPSCYTWFSLFAGISGPKYWHSEWSKAVRGIEKQIKQSTRVTDPITSDLCWIEYSWLSKTYENLTVFHNLPKLTPKLLSIEIVPGASCQLRLEEEVKNKPVDRVQSSTDKSRSVTNLLPVFSKMEELAKVGKMLLQSSGSISEEDMKSLLNNVLIEAPKTNKKKSKP